MEFRFAVKVTNLDRDLLSLLQRLSKKSGFSANLVLVLKPAVRLAFIHSSLLAEARRGCHFAFASDMEKKRERKELLFYLYYLYFPCFNKGSASVAGSEVGFLRRSHVL